MNPTDTKLSFSMSVKIKSKVKDPCAVNQWEIKTFQESGFDSLYDAFSWAEDIDIDEENILEIHITRDMEVK